jgi:hypothetical protein
MFVRGVDADGMIELTTLSVGSDRIVRVGIGFDDETEVTYSAVVAFSPIPGYGDGCYELTFALVESSGPDTDICWNYDGLATKGKIPAPADRKLVLAAVLIAVQALIDDVNPAVVEMVTHTPDLPQKALGKFNRIAALFGDRGYMAGKADEWHGRHIWMMKRST